MDSPRQQQQQQGQEHHWDDSTFRDPLSDAYPVLDQHWSPPFDTDLQQDRVGIGVDETAGDAFDALDPILDLPDLGAPHQPDEAQQRSTNAQPASSSSCLPADGGVTTRPSSSLSSAATAPNKLAAAVFAEFLHPTRSRGWVWTPQTPEEKQAMTKVAPIFQGRVGRAKLEYNRTERMKAICLTLHDRQTMTKTEQKIWRILQRRFNLAMDWQDPARRSKKTESYRRRMGAPLAEVRLKNREDLTAEEQAAAKRREEKRDMEVMAAKLRKMAEGKMDVRLWSAKNEAQYHFYLETRRKRKKTSRSAVQDMYDSTVGKYMPGPSSSYPFPLCGSTSSTR